MVSLTTNIAIPYRNLMRRITLDVTLTGVRVVHLRIALGCALIRLAARIMGCGIEFKAPSDAD